MTRPKPTIDYSLYLVTGRELLPQCKDYFESLEESLQGGVTLVQIREKNTETGEFLEIARRSKEICRKYNVPILINDRIDIALGMGADGVHIGQTDMPIAVARSLLPDNAVIGVTCNTVEHVKQAVKDGADYVGIGPAWTTQTKKLTSPVVGVRGLGDMLKALDGTNVKAVSIGGIKSTNALHCLHGAVSTTGHTLDGLAVVSDIVASPEPKVAAEKLATIVRAFKSNPPSRFSLPSGIYSPEYLKDRVGALISSIREHGPLIQQITNTVVTTQSANATLALGASPIMATAPQEMEDLSKAIGALLANFGTIADLDGMLLAGRHANINRKPIVFDPVGVGSSRYRRTSADTLLNTWQATVIKGNAGELASLANSQEVQSKGVDSVGTGFKDPVNFVRDLARKERSIVVLTGVQDYVSNGEIVVRLSNGHPYLGEITGSGCMVGTCVATFCAAGRLDEIGSESQLEDGKLVRGDMLVAAVGGVLALTVSSEYAAAREDVKGSGTFLPALIDELGKLSAQKIGETAKIEVFRGL
ncbi:Hydroxyethylthiazole kinase [Laetiporus sulphureus 93-53]|uniref:Hydroxyethylthiazole kinase n=1 Tax=Laetiporus sulphureus 93-53 TaxID=1314785 RepID=A0A165H077_9APHY|nr:Hydroxyethylthiazole kinase [Laetiporus sulphureus 93-53]KZT11068.1 Hydroxyethylthiazole kinase [Laetiporus sulphureus 93-53]